MSHKPEEGGKEEEAPGVVWGTGGPAGRGPTGGLTDGGGLRSRRAEPSGAARRAEPWPPVSVPGAAGRAGPGQGGARAELVGGLAAQFRGLDFEGGGWVVCL